MSIQLYSRKEWERDPTRLPDLEVFYTTGANDMDEPAVVNNDLALSRGWYWWSCTPGCLPDGEPDGPYKTASAAKRAALEGADDDL
jgi:hypothetical protein